MYNAGVCVCVCARIENIQTTGARKLYLFMRSISQRRDA